MVDAILNITVHKGGKVINGIVDAVVGNTSLRIVVGTYLCRAVTGRDHCLALGSDVVDVFLVLFVVYKGTQARQGAFFVLRLVARFGTFDENFLYDTRIRVLPVIAQA